MQLWPILVRSESSCFALTFLTSNREKPLLLSVQLVQVSSFSSIDSSFLRCYVRKNRWCRRVRDYCLKSPVRRLDLFHKGLAFTGTHRRQFRYGKRVCQSWGLTWQQMWPKPKTSLSKVDSVSQRIWQKAEANHQVLWNNVCRLHEQSSWVQISIPLMILFSLDYRGQMHFCVKVVSKEGHKMLRYWLLRNVWNYYGCGTSDYRPDKGEIVIVDVMKNWWKPRHHRKLLDSAVKKCTFWQKNRIKDETTT